MGIFCGMAADDRLYLTADALEQRVRIDITVADFLRESEALPSFRNGNVAVRPAGKSGHIRLWCMTKDDRFYGYIGTADKPVPEQIREAVAVARALKRPPFSNFDYYSHDDDGEADE